MSERLEKLENKLEKQMNEMNEKLNKVLERTVNETGFMKENQVHDMGIFLTNPVKVADIAVVDCLLDQI